jgi:hypothetical protein
MKDPDPTLIECADLYALAAASGQEQQCNRGEADGDGAEHHAGGGGAPRALEVQNREIVHH